MRSQCVARHRPRIGKCPPQLIKLPACLATSAPSRRNRPLPQARPALVETISNVTEIARNRPEMPRKRPASSKSSDVVSRTDRRAKPEMCVVAALRRETANPAQQTTSSPPPVTKFGPLLPLRSSPGSRSTALPTAVGRRRPSPPPARAGTEIFRPPKNKTEYIMIVGGPKFPKHIVLPRCCCAIWKVLSLGQKYPQRHPQSMKHGYVFSPGRNAANDGSNGVTVQLRPILDGEGTKGSIDLGLTPAARARTTAPPPPEGGTHTPMPGTRHTCTPDTTRMQTHQTHQTQRALTLDTTTYQ